MAAQLHEMASIFLPAAPLWPSTPILEAGCGSGKWMHYFKRQGMTAAGIDWSPALKAISDKFDSSIQYDVGDMRRMPYPDESFGSIIALGSTVEHVVEGPQADPDGDFAGS